MHYEKQTNGGGGREGERGGGKRERGHEEKGMQKGVKGDPKNFLSVHGTCIEGAAAAACFIIEKKQKCSNKKSDGIFSFPFKKKPTSRRSLYNLS